MRFSVDHVGWTPLKLKINGHPVMVDFRVWLGRRNQRHGSLQLWMNVLIIFPDIEDGASFVQHLNSLTIGHGTASLKKC